MDGLGIEAAREGSTLVQWVNDVRQNGLGTPAWLSHVPFIGNLLSAWWETNLADPDAARVLFGRAENIGILSSMRSLGVEVASRITILVFTLLALWRKSLRPGMIAHACSDIAGGLLGW